MENQYKNFNEVDKGYNLEEALQEAKRCIGCKNRPCVLGCPVNVDIPNFINKIKQKDFEGAYKIITNTNTLPAICGRVCPQETQCEAKCTLKAKQTPVNIGKLERFVADWFMKNKENYYEKTDKKNKSIAVVGSGPAGIACAGDLAKMGYNVTIFEAFHTTGGVLTYGIPEFRLPKHIVKKEIDNIKKLGVEINCNVVIGKTFTIDDLLVDYESVFISSGAGLPKFMGIEGEDLNGVYSANEFLTRINLMKAYKFPEYDTPIKVGNKVTVIGGGNVAMDAARCAKRLGTEEVEVLYRRSEEEIPARYEEIQYTKQEGINLKFLVSPVEISGTDGWVKNIKCVDMKLTNSDNEERRKVGPVENSEHVIETDTVVVAIGQTPNPLVKDYIHNLSINKFGGIETDDYCKTNIPGLFAGGDVVTGAATVISAMGAGKRAALSIDKYLKEK